MKHGRNTPTPQQRRLLDFLFRGGKFMVVGWAGMLVNSAFLYLFKGELHIPIIPASIMAIELAIIHNFIWLRYWAWRDRNQTNHQPFFRQLLLYNAATGGVDFTVNVSVLWILSTIFHVHYMLANILGMIAPPFFKYWLNDKLIFKEV